MRVRLPLGRGLFFLCVFLVALAALLPLRLALSWLAVDGLVAARRVEGSLWLGTLREARVAGAPLGDLRAALDPLPLVAGRARIDLAAPGALPLRGAISVTRHSFGLDDATALIPLGAAAAPLPVVAVDLDDVSVRFRDGLCERAEGLVRARLAADADGLPLPAALSGTARCEAGALMLPLASPGGDLLALSITAGGHYRAELLLRPGDAAVRDRLTAAGFSPAGGRLRLTVTGTFLTARLSAAP